MLPIYALAIFLSAFLLFLVEPFLGRVILPIFGGSPFVWTTSLAFFQTTLLLGYLYVFLTSRYLTRRQQLVVHSALLLVPLAFLPLSIVRQPPPANEGPTLYLLALLCRVVGVPFFVLSASGPLLQRWFAGLRHARAADPYFLYVASNAGSLGGLIAYPLLLEPLLTLQQQSTLFAVGYGASLAVLLAAAGLALRHAHNEPASASAATSSPSGAVRLRWLLLALVPSALLTSVTSYITTDMASIPLWWVIPLVLYLVSLMLAFADPPRWNHRLGLFALAYTLPLVILGLHTGSSLALVALHLLAYFCALMLCHGRLAALRPAVAHLSEYYVWMAAGGALGSVLCAIVAPLVFNGVAEYPLCLLAIACLGWLELPDPPAPRRDLVWAGLIGGGLVGLTAAGQRVWSLSDQTARMVCMGAALVWWLVRHRQHALRIAFGFSATAAVVMAFGLPESGLLHTARSFFGTYRVGTTNEGALRYLMSGTTLHGEQATDPNQARTPLTYYFPTGPVGQVMHTLASMAPRPVGVVGLGTGAMACYAAPGQTWTFYELDPLVVQLASDPQYFTFLRDCPASIVLGDARLSLADAPAHTFGALVLDAYGSDAIPVHLLTREAMALYLTKLAPGGVLLFHISNRHYNLPVVVGALAHDAGLAMMGRVDRRITDADKALGKTPSHWLLVARHAADLAPFASLPGWEPNHPDPSVRPWTDDFSSVVPILRLN